MPMRDETLDPRGLPWESGPRARSRQLRLVLAWAVNEPERVGECALLPPGAAVFGRGPRPPDDPLPRLELYRARPGSLERRPPFATPTLSRRQLQTDLDGGTVTVTPIGKCPVRIGGTRVTGPTVLPLGCPLVLENQLVFVLASWDPYADPIATAPFS